VGSVTHQNATGANINIGHAILILVGLAEGFSGIFNGMIPCLNVNVVSPNVNIEGGFFLQFFPVMMAYAILIFHMQY
jgi:hypothetical protein